MNKVILYGDSYAAPYDTQTFYEFKYSWPTELAKIVNLDNRAMLGCGPNTVCSKIYELINSTSADELIESILIVFLPEAQRFNFSFYKLIKDEVFGQMNDNVSEDFLNEFYKSYTVEDRNFLLRFKKEYLKDLEKIKLEEIKHLSFLNTISCKFKKVLVWRTDFPQDTDYSMFKNIDIAPIDTSTISLILEDIKDEYCDDFRINHLSIENHKIMLEQISNWIFYNIPIENKFKRLKAVDDNILNRVKKDAGV